MQACSDIEELPTQPLGPRGKSELNSVEREDPTLVTWNDPADPTNPLNWPQRKKWAVTILVSLGGMATMTSSTMIAPALSSISRDLHTDDTTMQLTLSIFVLSYAFGPMVLAPLSEVYGRKPVWLLSCCLYVLWNTVCGFSKTTGVMIAGRFFSGLGGSAQYAIELPVLADIWPKAQRGRSFAIATFLPLLGPALGPILGGLLTASPRLGGWRGIFWALSIFDATLIAIALSFFPETRAGTLLARKAKRLRRQNPEYHTEDEINNDISPARILGTSLLRPCKLLLTEPVLQLAAMYLAYNYGVLYIVHSTFANLFITHYGQSISTSGLHYIAMAVGCLVGAQVGGYLMDRYPESRIPVMIPGAVLLPAGLFLYGWTAEYRVFWVVPDLGIAIFSCGIILGTQAMQALVMDAYPEHVASANAGSQFPRNLTGFLFPLFAPRMYETLGYGWGTSLLAFLFLVIGIPVPLVLWKYGERLRRTP